MKRTTNELKPIDQPVYNYWQALYYSFFSKRLYVDVGKRWRGLGFLYLLLVVGILSIPLSIRIAMELRHSFQEEIVKPLQQLPPLYIQNGEISLDKPMPFLVHNDKGEVVLIVDTSGKITSFTEAYPKLSILINKDVIYYRLSNPNLFNSTQAPTTMEVPIAQHLDASMNEVFNGSKFLIEPSMSKLRLLSQIMVYPLVMAGLLAFFAIIFPVFAFLAQIFASVFFSFRLRYFQACRLLSVAATPMLVLLFVYLTANVRADWIGAILVPILGLYYIFALYALRSEIRQVVRQ